MSTSTSHPCERRSTSLIFRVLTLITMLISMTCCDACQYLKFSKQHTMCYYQTPGCPITNRGVTKSEIQFILDEHNRYRQKVATGQEKRLSQPAAADMRQMEWDTELALVSQKWAEQCKTQHDCSDCRQLPRFRVGQNIYMYASTADNSTTDWYTAVNEWYKEVAIFPPHKIEPFQHPQAAGHYTQLAWAGSYKIGCGYAYYLKDGWFTKLYVCDYGPAGNILEDRMYIKGPACSQCPEGTSCSKDYYGLCASGGSSGQSFTRAQTVATEAPASASQPWWAVTPSPSASLPSSPSSAQTTVRPWWAATGRPWWLAASGASNAISSSSVAPPVTRSPWKPSPPFSPAKKVLFFCDFDAKGCNPETVGSTPWTLQQSNSAQGNFYEVHLPRGNDAHLYIYTTLPTNLVDINGGAALSKACLSFLYKKYSTVGRQSVDMEVALWRQGKESAYTEFKVTPSAVKWTSNRMTVPAYNDVYSVSFHMVIPAAGHAGNQYIAVDQIRLDAGPCGN